MTSKTPMMFMKTSVAPLFDFNEVLHTLTSALQVFLRHPVLQRASSSSKKLPMTNGLFGNTSLFEEKSQFCSSGILFWLGSLELFLLYLRVKMI